MLVRLNHTIGFTSYDGKPSFDWAAPISLVHRSSSISLSYNTSSSIERLMAWFYMLWHFERKAAVSSRSLFFSSTDSTKTRAASADHNLFLLLAIQCSMHPLVINQYPARTRNEILMFFTPSTFLLLLQVTIYHALPKLIWSQAFQLTVIVFSSNLPHTSSV